MPRRDEEKRIEFLRSLSVEDLANRRITEFSSETEKQMIHQARDVIKEKNDIRYMKHHKAKAKVDIAKTQFNAVGRRAQNEVFGREGGLTGGMIGSWLVGGTLAAGSVGGGALIRNRAIAAQAAAKLAGTAGQVAVPAAQQIAKKLPRGLSAATKIAKRDWNFLNKNKSFLSRNDQKRLLFIRERYRERGRISGNDRAHLASMRMQFEKQAKRKLPVTQVPATLPASPVNNAARVLTGDEKNAIAKLKQGQRLSPNEHTALQALAKDKKLTQVEQNLLESRKRLAKSQRELKVLKTKSATAPPAKPVSQPKTISSESELTEKIQNKLDAAVQKITKLKMEKGNDDAFAKLAADISRTAEKYPNKLQQDYVIEALTHKAARFNKDIPNFRERLNALLKKK